MRSLQTRTSCEADSARAFFAKHSHIEISDALLETLVEDYAESLPEDQTEDFVERMVEPEYLKAIRLDFCACAMAVNGALFIDDDEVFRSYVRLIELSEDDEVIVRMKTFILGKLAEDALDAAGDPTVFNQRIAWARQALTQPDWCEQAIVV